MESQMTDLHVKLEFLRGRIRAELQYLKALIIARDETLTRIYKLHELAGVAQMAEQLSCKQPVVGSNPTASSDQESL